MMKRIGARLVTIAALARVGAFGCHGSAMQFFGRNGFQAGTLPPRPVESVELFFNDERPDCTPVVMGMIAYDASRDLRRTSITHAIAGLREHAAELGASGVLGIRREEGPTSGIGAAAYGVATVSTMQEVGLVGSAYVCQEELVARGFRLAHPAASSPENGARRP